MASSSDWIEQAGKPQPSAPSWLAELDKREGFRPGAPFAEALPGSVGEPVLTSSKEAPVQDAIARAFADGEAAGRAAAEADTQAEMARQRELRLTFRAFDQAALDSLANELGDTVIALCEQVLEASAIDRDGLIERCHWAARRLNIVTGQSKLHLHPDDIAMLGEDSLADWQVEADPTLTRGSLLLEGPDGAVRDGPAEWRRAIAEAVRG